MNWLPRLSGSRFRWVRLKRSDRLIRRSLRWLLTPALAASNADSALTPSISSDYFGEYAGVWNHRSQSTCRASIVLPVYNEQACIAQTFDSVLAYSRAHPGYDFIFVSDGSSDNTAEILQRRIAAAQSDRLRLIAYPDRGGKGYAVQRGVAHAQGSCVCFIDGDLAYSLDHLELLLAKLDVCDVVIGCRSLVPDGNLGLNPMRKVAGKVFNTLSKRILNLKYVDMQAGLKGFDRSAAKEIFSRQQLTGFSFDVELIYLARKLGYTIGEVPARVSSSHARKLSKVNLLVDSLKMLWDLFRIRFNDLIGRYE